MSQKVSNSEARGLVTSQPDNTAPIAPAAPVEGPIGTLVPTGSQEVDEQDYHSGRMTKFMPAMDFTGYPDGKTRTAYQEGHEAEAPANYVKLLKKTGRTA